MRLPRPAAKITMFSMDFYETSVGNNKWGRRAARIRQARNQALRLLRTARLRAEGAALVLAAGAAPAAGFADEPARARLAGALRGFSPLAASGWAACMPATVAAASVSNCFCSMFHQPWAAPDSAAGSD